MMMMTQDGFAAQTSLCLELSHAKERCKLLAPAGSSSLATAMSEWSPNPGNQAIACSKCGS
jgi:hypothetical protein